MVGIMTVIHGKTKPPETLNGRCKSGFEYRSEIKTKNPIM